jgi:hypothetical protein
MNPEEALLYLILLPSFICTLALILSPFDSKRSLSDDLYLFLWSFRLASRPSKEEETIELPLVEQEAPKAEIPTPLPPPNMSENEYVGIAFTLSSKAHYLTFSQPNRSP